jgi:microcystin-dependent protein
MVCDGRSLSRTTYAELFGAIGTTYGTATPSTFNIPNLQGYFVRGLNPNSTGVDKGRVFGSSQADDNKVHNHGVTDNGHWHGQLILAGEVVGGYFTLATTNANKNFIYSGNTETAKTNISIKSTGTESRPYNVAMLPCIKTTTYAAGGLFNEKGQLLTANADLQTTVLDAGSSGQMLTPAPAQDTGLAWVDNPAYRLSAEIISVTPPGVAAQIGDAVFGGYYAGPISTAGNGTADYGIIISPKAQGQYNGWMQLSKNGNLSNSAFDNPSYGFPASEYGANDPLNGFPALDWVRSLNINGFTDWYLPSLGEMQIIYTNLKPSNLNNVTTYGINPYAVPPRGSNYTATNPGVTSVSAFVDGTGSESLYLLRTNPLGIQQYVRYPTVTRLATSMQVVLINNGGTPSGNASSYEGGFRAIRRVPIADLAGGSTYTLSFAGSEGFSNLSPGDTITTLEGASATIAAVSIADNTITLVPSSVVGQFYPGDRLFFDYGFVANPTIPGNNGQVLSLVGGQTRWVNGGGGGGGVATVSGTAPITIDYTDPEDPVIGVSTALPASVGTVYGSTPNSADSTTIFGYFGSVGSIGVRNTYIGYMAGAEIGSGSSTNVNDNIALGYQAMLNPDTNASSNIAVGRRALGGGGNSGLSGSNNIAIGSYVGINMINSSRNTIVGSAAGQQLSNSNDNVILGYNAANDGFQTNNSVIIGSNVTARTLGVDSQLAIGFGAGKYWITGDSTGSIGLGGGIYDENDSLGTAGQVLTSTGSGVQWSAPAPSTAYPVIYKSTGSVTTSGSYGSATVIYDTPILTNSAATYTNANGRLTPQLAGVWVITATARCYDDPNTESAVSMVFNDTTSIAGTGSIGQVAATITGMEVFNGTTDYVRVRITTQTGATNSQNGNRLTAYYLGPAV